MKIATGKYIGFVDSDDFVSLDMFRILYENAERNNADISYLFLSILLSGLFVSVSVELLQYITSRGLTEIDDVINNTAGAIIGWLAYDRMLKAVKRKR